ncbi:MBL fold metallo-hydrolase [Candidatus Woesearchaeota archaeon]|nr:MBL fold metallo-hydrolase [Candidatus Woesearchaeota archaeon]
MKITFCGAARIVTGSCYLIEAGKSKVLVDCGMFQGTKDITRLNYKPFLFDPKKIDYLFLTHAHIDHSGLIPKLVKYGFRGKIFATSATIDLCRIMLDDSAHIQYMENEHENKRLRRQGLPQREPLYTDRDVSASIPLFKKVDYNKLYNIEKNIKVRYKDAGHIIGSSIIEMFVEEKGREKKIVFSGDLGQWDVPIIEDPTMIDDADYVLIESTYGDRLHEEIADRDSLLLKYSKEAYKRKGKLLIPSFAIERTQELLYSFNKLIKQGKFPDMKIFLDSPLAIKATEIFKKHHEFFDEEALTRYKNPFRFSNLEYTPTARDSKKLNNYNKPCVIIAGSGMCTAGRIRHHLRHGLWDPKNIVLFVGYQAEGTLGRYLLEGAKEARMMGMVVDVNADIQKINSFSAHADYNELVRWSKGFVKKPKKIFIIHGEYKSSKALKERLNKIGFNSHIPKIGEKVEL